jgi:hypothetical protein
MSTRFAVALSGAVGYGKPYGNWFDGFGGGEAYHGQIRLAVTGNFYVLAAYRQQTLPIESESPVATASSFYDYGDLELRQMLFGLGFMPKRSDVHQAIPYLELGFGRTTHERKAVGAASDVELDGDADYSIDKRTVFAQAGLIMPMGRGVALEMGVSAVHTGTDLLRFNAGDDSGTVVGAQIGLTFLLGQMD